LSAACVIFVYLTLSTEIRKFVRFLCTQNPADQDKQCDTRW